MNKVSETQDASYDHSSYSNSTHRTVSTLELIAYHEAAHAVTSVIFNNSIKMEYVTIIPMTHYDFLSAGHLFLEKHPFEAPHSLDKVRDTIVMVMAGPIAWNRVLGKDRLVLEKNGEPLKKWPNFHDASLIHQLSLYSVEEREYHGYTPRQLERQRKAFLEHCKIVAKDFVDLHWEMITFVAVQLVEHKTLTQEQVEEIMIQSC
ncbi:MAG: hypothetical protein R6V10_07415 [bacterium]